MPRVSRGRSPRTPAAAEAASYAYVLAKAERLGNGKAVRAMRAIGPPPYDAQALWTERMWLNRLDGQMTPRALWRTARLILGAPESSILEVPSAMRAFRKSIDAMWRETSRINLLELAPALRMPVFFFLGRQDHFVPPETSVAYFDALIAPSKKLLWFEESGHEPFVDEPSKFNAAMTQLVRPAVEPRPSREEQPEAHP